MSTVLTYSTLPLEIKKIGNESLGIGVLKSLFVRGNTYHLMIKVSDGIFIGFALYHFKRERLSGGKTRVIGIIDAVCVSTAHRQEGFGTLLTYGVLRKMSAYGVDRVDFILKTPGIDDTEGQPGVPLIGSENLLFRLGFRKVKRLDGHYDSVSKRMNYDCLLCGDRPDTCKGVLYSISSK